MRHRGFTLIEIVLVITVLSILGLFIFSFLYFHAKTYATMAKEREIHEEATYALERITRELRDGDLIILPNELIPNSNILVIRKSHITPADNNRYITFYIQGGQLFRGSSDLAPPPPYITNKPIAKNVRTFNVSFDQGELTRIADDGIRIELTIEKDGYGITYVSFVCPKNLPLSLLNRGYFRGRHFNGDYEDVTY